MIKFDNISVIISCRPNKYCRRNLEFNKRRMEKYIPGAEIVYSFEEEYKFNKGRNINALFSKTHGERLIIIDSNMLLDYYGLYSSLISETWAVPFMNNDLISKEDSTFILGLEPDVDFNNIDYISEYMDKDLRYYAFVLKREMFGAVNGYSEDMNEWDVETVDFYRRMTEKYGSPKICRGRCRMLFEEVPQYPSCGMGVNIDVILPNHFELEK